MTKPQLSIIIVNWNGINFLPNCLKSIAENPPSVPFEVIVVDNASHDRSVEWMKSAEAAGMLCDTNFTLIESKENLGFGRGNNLVIEKSTASYIFLLNPDTILKPGVIDKLLVELNSSERIGAVAPKLLNEDGSLQESVYYFPPTPIKIILESFRLYKFLPKRYLADTLLFSHWDHSDRRVVPIVWGAAILFKGDILRRLKGFDTDFFIYGEDMDICVRLSKIGFDLEFIPNAEITHLGGQSSLQQWTDTEINEKKIKMGILFEQKHCGRILFFANSVTRLIVEGIRFVINPLMGRDNRQVRKTIRLYFRSMFDPKAFASSKL